MKTKLLVPAMYAREMIDGPDLDRYLASGSYLIGTRPKKPSAVLERQRKFQRRRAEAGYKILRVLLPGYVFNALHAELKDGETIAELVERLISNTTDKSLSQEHN